MRKCTQISVQSLEGRKQFLRKTDIILLHLLFTITTARIEIHPPARHRLQFTRKTAQGSTHSTELGNLNCHKLKVWWKEGKNSPQKAIYPAHKQQGQLTRWTFCISQQKTDLKCLYSMWRYFWIKHCQGKWKTRAEALSPQGQRNCMFTKV